MINYQKLSKIKVQVIHYKQLALFINSQKFSVL